ncbi:hypothetical protein, unlikely [Trypanosoma brucei brucei TREU927]|uniref:Secreted protein n=1 Tax=Trypanosoma brucei brucei (strain 927/4 GUTat10.1) TaxID=185431 RepID=Q38EV7_TRYB2|nr:hypothetical protein, unlikely [Trypanosoma brucei brucei TREU927]EAN76663.1 hypothetical protein, unlikely [Trypanosoma brucei brucei TREU927]
MTSVASPFCCFLFCYGPHTRLHLYAHSALLLLLFCLPPSLYSNDVRTVGVSSASTRWLLLGLELKKGEK